MKKYYNYILVTLCILGSYGLQAQQDPEYSLYNYTMHLLNPAYAGTSESEGVSLAYRKQWLGFPDAPTFITGSFSTSSGENVGLGFNIYHNEYTIVNRTLITADFSYKIKVGDTTQLYFGLKAGASILNVDYSRLDNINPDPVFSENVNETSMVLGFGMYLVNPNYYITVSTPQFLQREIENSSEPNGVNFYFGGGYHIPLNENLTLTPRTFYRLLADTDNTFDLGASLDIDEEKFTFGVNHSFDRMVTVYGLFKIVDPLRVGLSYDFVTREFISSDTDGSIDFVLRYKI